MTNHHPTRVRETMRSRAAAQHLADAIKRYWDERGYTIETRIIEDAPGPTIYCVRSDIGPRGFPPRRKAAYGLLAIEPSALQ